MRSNPFRIKYMASTKDIGISGRSPITKSNCEIVSFFSVCFYTLMPTYLGWAADLQRARRFQPARVQNTHHAVKFHCCYHFRRRSHCQHQTYMRRGKQLKWTSDTRVVSGGDREYRECRECTESTEHTKGPELLQREYREYRQYRE